MAVTCVAALTLVACGETPSPSASDQSSASSGPSASVEPSASVSPFQGAWEDVTAEAIGETADWSNKVELADINGDGAVDLLFANGGAYETPGTPVASTVFLYLADGAFRDVTAEVFGDLVGLTRVIKARDLNADGFVDLLLGNTFDTQSHLLLGGADGSFTDVTATNLPAAELSVGDLEVGDVDADGDLDVVLADWGDGNPFDATGRTQLWLNDGSAVFTDATAAQMPETLVGFSWEIELVDIENDWDLDLAVSCKVCEGSNLFENDGTGTFTDVTDGRLPQFGNNYEFTALDLDGDGYLDLATVNDGPNTGRGLSEHIFRNDGAGAFEDWTDAWWTGEANPGYDDNMVVAIDIESDGDADFFLGSLDGPDRLLLNDGTGVLTMVIGLYDAAPSQGTLGWAVADLNGDHRPDLVESQGETPGHEAEKVYFATDAVPTDTAAPIITTDYTAGSTGQMTVHARVHDNRTPNMPHDWQAVEIRFPNGDILPMTWYGENLFRAVHDVPADAGEGQVCAVDAAGNEACV
jgi:hypothetical protein